MRNERYLVAAYDVAIVYFETLMKHLDAGGKVGIAEVVRSLLFHRCGSRFNYMQGQSR